jgi:hypothetical protein
MTTTISRERLHQAACALHDDAEQTHRADGVATMAALFVPPEGPAVFCHFPEGLPPAEVLAAIVRDTGAAGIAVTGEVWESEPGIPGTILVDMAFDDMLLPANDPSATEAIVTTAAGLGTDGPIKLLRRTRIDRTGHSTVLHEAVDLNTAIRDDGLAALLALALAAGSTDSGSSEGRPEDAPTGNAAAPDDQEQQRVCPDCSALIGELHDDACCVAWCAVLGRQRRDGCDSARGCRTDPQRDCRTTWSGLHPGIAECREIGWFAVRGPDGWTSTAPGTPGAVEDVSRLIAEAVWDPRAQRYRAPGNTADPDSGLPPGGDRIGEGG